MHEQKMKKKTAVQTKQNQLERSSVRIHSVCEPEEDPSWIHSEIPNRFEDPFHADWQHW